MQDLFQTRLGTADYALSNVLWEKHGGFFEFLAGWYIEQTVVLLLLYPLASTILSTVKLHWIEVEIVH
jgi:hypothetical protein